MCHWVLRDVGLESLEVGSSKEGHILMMSGIGFVSRLGYLNDNDIRKYGGPR